MTTSSLYLLTAIVVMAAVTFFLRAFPFIFGRWFNQYPWVKRLALFLPPAIMALLVLHTLIDLGSAQAKGFEGFVPVTVCVGIVLLIHWRWRLPLLSILLGTSLYMVWLNWGLI